MLHYTTYARIVHSTLCTIFLLPWSRGPRNRKLDNRWRAAWSAGWRSRTGGTQCSWRVTPLSIFLFPCQEFTFWTQFWSPLHSPPCLLLWRSPTSESRIPGVPFFLNNEKSWVKFLPHMWTCGHVQTQDLDLVTCVLNSNPIFQQWHVLSGVAIDGKVHEAHLKIQICFRFIWSWGKGKVW